MAPTYQTFADEESLLSQPPKTTSTRKAAGVAALVLFAVLGVSTTSRGYSMLDIVSAASGGIDFERTVTGSKIGWSLTAKAGLFPVKIEGECDVCGPPGSTCVVEIPFAENPVIPLAECPPPTAVTSAEFATNLTLPRKAPNLGPFKSIKVVDPSVIYLKDGSGATLVELDVELKVD